MTVGSVVVTRFASTPFMISNAFLSRSDFLAYPLFPDKWIAPNAPMGLSQFFADVPTMPSRPWVPLVKLNDQLLASFQQIFIYHLIQQGILSALDIDFDHIDIVQLEFVEYLFNVAQFYFYGFLLLNFDSRVLVDTGARAPQ
jgi:hypothetical protein